MYFSIDIRVAKLQVYDDSHFLMLTTLHTYTYYSGLQEFHKFVDPIVADGGADTPEDIMGALKVTFSQLSWRPSCSKVITSMTYLFYMHLEYVTTATTVLTLFFAMVIYSRSTKNKALLTVHYISSLP